MIDRKCLNHRAEQGDKSNLEILGEPCATGLASVGRITGDLEVTASQQRRKSSHSFQTP